MSNTGVTLQHLEEKDKEAIRMFVEDLLQERIRRLRLEVLHAPPKRPRAGDIVVADGVDWNPGDGSGTYEYTGTVYRKLYNTGGGGSVTISTTAPGSPAAGDLWWNSETGLLYIYYNDGTSSQWVTAGDNAFAGSGGTGTVTSVAATAPAAGFTISGSPITLSGTFTFTLANDLAALEGLASTGYARRTGTDAWTLDSTIPWSSISSTPTTLAGYGVSDAYLLDRANHTGTQVASTISDFSEAVDDRVAALLVAGTNITLTYNDIANTLTIDAAGGGGSALGFNDHWIEWWLGANTNIAPSLFLPSAISSGTNSTAIPTAVYSPTLNPYGGVFLRSSTTANGGYRYQTVRLDAMWFGTISHKFRCRFLFRSSFTNVTARIGFLDTTTSADAVDGAYFEIVAGTASAKTANNSVRTTNATTLALTIDTYYDFDIEVNAAGTDVRFRIYNPSTGATLLDVNNTTNIPVTSARATGAGIVCTESSVTATDMGVLVNLMIGTIAGFNKLRG